MQFLDREVDRRLTGHLQPRNTHRSFLGRRPGVTWFPERALFGAAANSMGFARGFMVPVPSASRICVSGSLGLLQRPGHPKTRLNTNRCSERTFLATEGTCCSERPLRGHLVLQAPFFPAGVRKTRNDPQCPRVQGGTLDANGVKLNYLKFGNSAVRPSAADPFCGSWWEKSWGSRGPEAALASSKKSPH